MFRTIGLVIILSAVASGGEAVNAVPERTRPTQQRTARKFHPLRAIQRMHNGLVNGAIHLSSIGIEQLPDSPEQIDLSFVPKPLFSDTHRPACDVQLTAMVLPQ